MKIRRIAPLTAAACLMAGCGTQTPATPQVSASSSAPSAIHAYNWAGVTAPGAACFSSAPIHLKAETTTDSTGAATTTGSALIPNDTVGHPSNVAAGGPGYVHLFVDPKAVAYGDLDGTGGDEAAVVFLCDNNGGTASGALLMTVGIYRTEGADVSLIELVKPGGEPLGDGRPPLAKVITLSPGKLVIDVLFFGPIDQTSTPSGRARTTWTYADGHLSAGSTIILHAPDTA